MENDNLLGFSNVRQRMTSWFRVSEFRPHSLRGLVMGAVISVTMAEVTVYLLIRQTIKSGDLPDYFTDLLVVIMACLEALISPFFSWLGYRSRRNTYIYWHLACTVFIFVLALPGVEVNTGTELCSPANLPFVRKPVSLRIIFRVIILILITLPFMFARLGIWAHSIAQMDDHKPEEMAQHFGILVAVRTIGLILAVQSIGSLVENNVWVKVTILLVGLAVNVSQLFRIPADVDQAVLEGIPSEKRGFTESVGRVLRNKLAVTQILAMAFLAAALWGFGSHERDIVLEKYNINQPENIVFTYATVLRFHVIVIMLLFFAMAYSPPIMATFDKLKAVKFGATLSMMLCALYLVVVFFFCTKGHVTGLRGSQYEQPACSLQCGRCSTASNTLSPVCVVEQMSTYLSPCHAGCTEMEEMGGIQFYSNCTCAGFGRATVGPCGDRSCNGVLQIHHIVYTVIITMTVVSFQMHGMTMLRAVDPRDKSVSLGVAGSFIAIIAFVLGQGVFVAIRRSTCAWYEGYHCNLHTPTFTLLIGITSAIFTLLAAIISFTTWYKSRNDEKSDVIAYDDETLNR